MTFVTLEIPTQRSMQRQYNALAALHQQQPKNQQQQGLAKMHRDCSINSRLVAAAAHQSHGASKASHMDGSQANGCAQPM
jgi:hypothetical protein